MVMLFLKTNMLLFAFLKQSCAVLVAYYALKFEPYLYI